MSPEGGSPKGISPKGISPKGISPEGLSPEEKALSIISTLFSLLSNLKSAS
jgi:hypothetical protein